MTAPFDRFAQFQESQGQTLDELLDTFEELRAENLAVLESMELDQAHLDLTGTRAQRSRPGPSIRQQSHVPVAEPRGVQPGVQLHPQLE